MSDQQQSSGEPSARRAGAAAPDAEAIAAQLTGAAKPPTASEPEGNDPGGAAATEPGAGAGEGEGKQSAGSTGRSETGTATAEASAGSEGEAEGAAAGATAGRAGVTAEKAEGGKAEAGEPEEAEKAEEGNGGSAGTAAQGEGATGTDGARALSAAATRGQHEAVATTVSSKGAASSTEGGIGRPRKPVLAGAALAGALLVAVPLLITVTDKDENKKNVDNAASDTVLNEAGGPAGVFATQTPSSSPSKAKKEKKNRVEAPVPPAAEKGAASSPSPTPKPSPSKKKEEEEAPVKRAASNLPAVLTRVLIKNNTNHTCVDVPGFTSGRADGPVTHATCNSNTDDNQLWNVEKRYDKAGPGGVPLFQIRNVMDSMCLDLPGYRGVGGATKVTEFPCNGTTSDNQLWWLDKQADGNFWIRNAASNNQCLDSYANNDDTRSLIIWPCAPEGQNNHEWRFTRS